MSSSLGLVRSIYAARERNDFSSTDWADPAIEFVLTGGAPGDFSARGIAAMERGWGDFLASGLTSASTRRRSDHSTTSEASCSIALTATAGPAESRSEAKARLSFTFAKAGARLVNYANREQGDLGMEK